MGPARAGTIVRGPAAAGRRTRHDPLMRHLPLFASLRDRRCLVVGGGEVAERRVNTLRAAGARVRVVAPSLTPGLEALAQAGDIEHEAKTFLGGPVDGFWLIVAATDSRATNAAVAGAAEQAQVLCNVVDDPALCSFIMPSIIDRDPVTIAVSSAGSSPVVARRVRRMIERAVPRRIGRLAALFGSWRSRVADRIAGFDERRRFWEDLCDGAVAEHALAGRDADAESALSAALEQWVSAASGRAGEAWFVGAGPGDPELMTLRGQYLLSRADTILYDRLVHAEILDYARRDAEFIAVGKQTGRATVQQVEINRLLVERVTAGERVCRLKGGDPMVFGRIGEELEALAAAGLPFQIVPGISSVEACAAYAGIPLTLRDESQAVLIATGHTREHVEADLSGFQARQTLALFMSVGRLKGIADRLLELGHAPQLPAAIIERGTTDRQRVVVTTLAELHATASARQVSAPAMILIGPTVAWADRYRWFDGADGADRADDADRADGANTTGSQG